MPANMPNPAKLIRSLLSDQSIFRSIRLTYQDFADILEHMYTIMIERFHDDSRQLETVDSRISELECRHALLTRALDDLEDRLNQIDDVIDSLSTQCNHLSSMMRELIEDYDHHCTLTRDSEGLFVLTRHEEVIQHSVYFRNTVVEHQMEDELDKIDEVRDRCYAERADVESERNNIWQERHSVYCEQINLQIEAGERRLRVIMMGINAERIRSTINDLYDGFNDGRFKPNAVMPLTNETAQIVRLTFDLFMTSMQ